MTSQRTDRELQAKLDQFTVPPLPSAFADRVVAATAGRQARPAALPLRRTSSNPVRRPWRRPGHVLAAAVALSLVSAAAAATGAFGNAARTAVADAPVIGPLIVETIPQIAKKPAAPVRQAKARPELENAPAIAASRAEASGPGPEASASGY